MAWWGAELDSRRNQAIVAWDYDVDAAVFVTEGVDIDDLWKQVSWLLGPLGMRGTRHQSWKFRFSPNEPVVWHPWRELYTIPNA